MDKIIRNKLKSNAGESIAETLVAVLISAFALLMLAGTVNTASNLITNSQASMEVYYEKNNSLADRTAESETLTVTIKSKETGGTVNQSKSVLSYSLSKDDSSILGSNKLITYN